MRKAFGDGHVFGTVHGRAPFRVVALPGWMRTVADFGGVVAGLPTGSVALDLPGFGGVNPEPPAVWGAADFAAWAAPMLDEVDAPVVLVGHSRGGAVALHLAIARPDRVGAVVLTGAPLLRRAGPPRKAPAAFRVARALRRAGLLPEAQMEAMRQRHGSADYRNARGVMRDILVKVTNESYERELAELRAPVELVWGEDDDAVPVEVARRAADAVRAAGGDATLTVLPGVGHQVPLQAPAELREATVRAIERLAG